MNSSLVGKSKPQLVGRLLWSRSAAAGKEGAAPRCVDRSYCSFVL